MSFADFFKPEAEGRGWGCPASVPHLRHLFDGLFRSTGPHPSVSECFRRAETDSGHNVLFPLSSGSMLIDLRPTSLC